jgi:hypothetical protein
VKTSEGLSFWASASDIDKIYGRAAFTTQYDLFMLESLFYFDRGITFDSRGEHVRSVHLYKPSDATVVMAEFMNKARLLSN